MTNTKLKIVVSSNITLARAFTEGLTLHRATLLNGIKALVVNGSLIKKKTITLTNESDNHFSRIKFIEDSSVKRNLDVDYSFVVINDFSSVQNAQMLILRNISCDEYFQAVVTVSTRNEARYVERLLSKYFDEVEDVELN